MATDNFNRLHSYGRSIRCGSSLVLLGSLTDTYFLFLFYLFCLLIICSKHIALIATGKVFLWVFEFLVSPYSCILS